MANPKIEVEIGAKTQGLRSGVNLAEKELNNLGRAAQQTSPKVNNLSQSISGANGVGIEFSRIIQDAPFGIIGVGNNITQLAGSFSNLQKQTGSAGKALKVAFQSIISPANLLVLGISAVTTALTLYQMGAFKSKEETEDLDKSLDKFNETVNQTIERLSRLERAQLNASISAEKEFIEVESLFAILSDLNIDQATRVNAYNQLVKLYPKVLGGLTQEKALTSDLTIEYNKLRDAIQQKALAQTLEDEFLANIKEQRNLQKQLNAETAKEEELRTKLAAALVAEERQRRLIRDIQKSGQNLRGISPSVDVSESQRLTLELEKQSKIVQLTKTLINGQNAEAESLKTEIIEINKQLSQVFGISTNIEDDIKSIESSINRINANPLQLVQPSQEQLLERLRARYQELQTGGIVEAPRTLSTAASNAPGITTELPIESIADTTISNLDKIQLKVEDLQGAFSGLGSLIGQAFNNQPLGNFFGVFLPFAAKLIGTNFKIATSASIAKGTQDSLFGGPFTLPAFIAGAVGVVSAAFASIGGGRQASLGVSGVGGGQAQSFTGGGLENAFLSGLNVSGQIEVDGTKLLVIIENALKKQNRG